MSEFTKGPWDLVYSEDSDVIHVGPIDERGIMPSVVVALHGEADAQLIAAAPDLYEALAKVANSGLRKNFLGEVMITLSQESVDDIVAALAKASGQEKGGIV